MRAPREPRDIEITDLALVAATFILYTPIWVARKLTGWQ